MWLAVWSLLFGCAWVAADQKCHREQGDIWRGLLRSRLWEHSLQRRQTEPVCALERLVFTRVNRSGNRAPKTNSWFSNWKGNCAQVRRGPCSRCFTWLQASLATGNLWKVKTETRREGHELGPLGGRMPASLPRAEACTLPDIWS